VAPTLLAAGLGRRLGGRPKSALSIDGVSLLERLLAAVRGAGTVSRPHVVIGPYADTLLPLTTRCGAMPLRHTLPEPSLVDSQRLAAQAHLDDPARQGMDLMLLVADLPELAAEHIAPLLQAWAQRATGVRAMVPVADGVRGHPVILAHAAVQAIATLPAGQGVRDWMRQHPDAVALWPGAHPACVTDLDTPEDLQALQRQLAPAVVQWLTP
jgi:molybdenum cofactor cytidylyltransferase